MKESVVMSTISTQPSGQAPRGQGSSSTVSNTNSGVSGGVQRHYNHKNHNHSSRGLRKGNRNQAKSDNSTKPAGSRCSTFKGNTEGMNGHTFDCCDESHDRTQFSKTLDALKEYVAKNLKRSDDLRSIFE
jgi:hypothetical protein